MRVRRPNERVEGAKVAAKKKAGAKKSRTPGKKGPAPARKPAARKPARKKKASPPATVVLETPEKLLEALRLRLRFLVPPLRRFPVEKPGAEEKKNFYLLDLSQVLYMTTDPKERGAYAVAFVTQDGDRYFSAKPLTHIAQELEDGNPWFMQTHQSYIVNLAKVVRWRYSRARDLWFEGRDEPLENAVSDTFRDTFDARVLGA